MNKKILGLDLGTNSIGWALVDQDFEKKEGKILGMGSRIIPMSQDILGEFDKGNSVSQTAERTKYRSARRLRERHLLRRERLHRVLNVLGFLPEHYAAEIDFEHRLGKFFEQKEPKLVYNNEKQFIFKRSFEEMLNDFKNYQPHILKNEKGEDQLIPYDWTIYYLRKKALAQKIEKEELAWLILNFNQKRGYYQLRGEEDETTDKREYVEILKIAKIEKGEVDKKNNKRTWYKMFLSNGWEYSATFTSEPLWHNTEKEFLVTEEIDENGNVKTTKDKEKKEKRKITPLPSFEEIDLMSKNDQDKIYKKIKARTEITIANSGKTVGSYIYDTLLQNPTQKIKGKLVRTIERKFYKEELKRILKKQKEFHTELQNEDLYIDCVRELYRNNETQQLALGKKDITHLFVEDIIFYQRPLKSKKSSISNCSLEYRKFEIKDKDGKEIEKTEYLKATPKSNPYYQEFRLWQWLYNLVIYKKEDDVNVTNEFLNAVEDYEKLFEFLNNRREIEQKPLIKYFLEQKGLKGKALNVEAENYRWNYVEDKIYPCNETKAQISSRLAKVDNVTGNFLTREVEQQLWHIIYSVTDKADYEKALKSFAAKHNLDEHSFVEAFKKFPPFKSEYGAFSEKAIKKLLPLMRLGKYWNWNTIDDKTKDRINKIINGEYDENIKEKVREKAIHLTEENHFQGLQLWLTSYIVYGRHSEANIAGKWNSVDDLKKYLEEFKQHSLRNPIVEQVVTETLRVVGDIWNYYGNGAKDFFDEIHIELGREMKNTAEDRKKITNQISENENTSLRIKALLAEMLNDNEVENVRPYSPMQQEALKIYEDGVLNSDIEIPEDIAKISKTAQPSKAELTRYKLWLEQKYRSPYTGAIIPLNRLFTTDYEIEHIIPQSRFFDDSFSNKVICESAVNKLKDNQVGLEFIKNHHGEIVETGRGNCIRILDEEEYKEFVKQYYAKNRSKRNKLLLEDIPEKMIERQMNDTRYISKFISSVLSNIVREDKNDDGVNSKNIIPGNGKITTALKQDWGLNDVWNDLILPRFERMNEITKSKVFTTYNDKYQKYLPTVPLELSKNFQKKRIDHRHHAMDALVIACATRDHVNLLNNQSANSDTKRYDLQYKLRNIEKWKDNYGRERDKFTEFKKPWNNFTADAKSELEKIVVSFKQNLRIINKTTNRSEKWNDKNGIKLKEVVPQTKGDSWAIRKSMHKDTVSGKVEISRIKVPKGKILTATRKSIDISFDLKTIESITDTGIQKILKNYLLSKNNNPGLAFSPESIEDMNRNIKQHNDGKDHQPIYKVRIFELGSKFPLGQSGNKKTKYVEAAKGTNLFFAIYQDERGKRNYDPIPLNEVMEHQKWRATLSTDEQKNITMIPIKPEYGTFMFYLSPNDLVYIPTEDECHNINRINWTNLSIQQIKNIYKTVSFSGNQIFFIRHEVATSVVNKEEFSTLNKMERAIDGRMIKETCIKILIDRLGNISRAKQ